LKEVTAQDLVEFGFETEFVGRLPVVVVFDELRKADLVEILSNPNNPILLSKRLDFRAYGIDIRFEAGALEKIAERAAAEKTGARGLVSVIEKVLIPFEKRLPSTGIKTLLVTADTVEDPEGELERLLSNPDDPDGAARFDKARTREIEVIRDYILDRQEEFLKKSSLKIYERRVDLIAEIYLRDTSDVNTAFESFKELHDQIRVREEALNEAMEVKVHFDDSAVDEIIRQAVISGQEAGDLAVQISRRLEYGLNLVKERTGIDRFLIDAEAVTDMDRYVNKLIKSSYRQEGLDPWKGDTEKA
jgi:ATP-dependent protease Clp ATPase subunit